MIIERLSVHFIENVYWEDWDKLSYPSHQLTKHACLTERTCMQLLIESHGLELNP